LNFKCETVLRRCEEIITNSQRIKLPETTSIEGKENGSLIFDFDLIKQNCLLTLTNYYHKILTLCITGREPRTKMSLKGRTAMGGYDAQSRNFLPRKLVIWLCIGSFCAGMFFTNR